MKKVLLFTLLTVITATGCRMWGVRGNGNVIEEKRDIEFFNQIKVGGVFTIYVSIGDETTLKIFAEENLLKYIRTYVKGKTLQIDTRKNLSPRRDVKIYITTPVLFGIESSGANNITVEGINGENFYAEMSGAGKMDLDGTSTNLKLELSGAGYFDARKLKAENVTVSVSGAASADVYANHSLKASVSGVGSVNFYGNPEKVRTNVSGVGSINRK